MRSGATPRAAHRAGLSAALAIALLLHTGCAATGGKQRHADEPAIRVQELVKTTKTWDGKLLPAYPRGQPQITIRRVTIPPGVRLETHSHPVINAGVLTKGQLMVVTTTGKRLRLNEGDAIVELVNTPHYGFNPGKVPAEIVVVYAGDADTPVSIARK